MKPAFRCAVKITVFAGIFTPIANVSVANKHLIKFSENSISIVSFRIGNRPPWCIPIPFFKIGNTFIVQYFFYIKAIYFLSLTHKSQFLTYLPWIDFQTVFLQEALWFFLNSHTGLKALHIPHQFLSNFDSPISEGVCKLIRPMW